MCIYRYICALILFHALLEEFLYISEINKMGNCISMASCYEFKANLKSRKCIYVCAIIWEKFFFYTWFNFLNSTLHFFHESGKFPEILEFAYRFVGENSIKLSIHNYVILRTYNIQMYVNICIRMYIYSAKGYFSRLNQTMKGCCPPWYYVNVTPTILKLYTCLHAYPYIYTYSTIRK